MTFLHRNLYSEGTLCPDIHCSVNVADALVAAVSSDFSIIPHKKKKKERSVTGKLVYYTQASANFWHYS